MTIQQTISPALEAFGIAIKDARQARGWSLSTLALEALGNEDRKGYCSQVEKGRRKLSEGTIANFARALDLPATATDPLLGNVLPQTEDTNQLDETASALIKEAEILRDQLKLSEALAIALAYKYADGNPTDMAGALNGLEAALELAAKDQERGKLKSNFEDAVDDIVARVNALNDDGEIDEAYADLKAEATRRKEAREAQTAQDGRVLDMLITQATLANDADGFAEAHLERIQLDSPSAEDSFKRLRSMFSERYNHGVRFGTPFALTAAIGLARKCVQIAPTDALRAMAQNDLAVALQNQGIRTAGEAGAALLADAVESYRAALRVRTEADHPVDWAMTMQNLGIALRNQGSRTTGAAGATLLAEAVDSYRAALRVRTEEDHPVDWATTMQNLGNALGDQGIRTTGAAGAALLAEAVESYRAALRVYTEEEHSVEWGKNQENTAIAELDWSKHDSCTDPIPRLTAALAHVDNALRVYDPEHMSYYHERATDLREAILASLSSSSS